MRIVLDAMGSDKHPGPEVEAALKVLRQDGGELVLVGNRPELEGLLPDRPEGLEIMHAADVFEMTDHVSLGRLREAEHSMGVAMDLLKHGKADAFVTAGNTGGAMATGLTRLGRIKGVQRPALTAPFPVKGGVCMVLDAGANAECKPEYLLQFALMGSAYAAKMLGLSQPRVGLLSNGEEEGKGDDLVKAAFPLLKESGLNFVGNIEPKELFGGMVDVAVTDGFTGNVMMKASEAVARLLVDTLRESLTSSLRTKVGALLARPAFNELRKLIDSREIGAVPLLGIDGLIFVGHGRSDAKALVSAIRLARRSVEAGLLDSLRAAIEAGISQLARSRAG
ncbi:MAG: phosphate acyltransferase PlsX [Anaerolineales bacterium]